MNQMISVVIRPAILFLMAIFLQGCAISQFTSSLSGGWFGKKNSGGAQTAGSYDNSVSNSRLLAAAKSDVGGSGDSIGLATGCPKFVAWPNGRLLTKYEPGREGDNLAIMYRGEITKTARECKISPGNVGIRYGFAGRVLLGPRGQSGTVKLPILVHVTDRDRNKIKTERFMIPVSVRKDDPIGYFSSVKVVKFNVPVGGSALEYKLYVAFEQSGPR